MIKIIFLSIVLCTLHQATNGADVKVAYHLWFDPTPSTPDPSLPQIQLHEVTTTNQSTFFQVMEKAAKERPDIYQFTYDNFSFGHYITGIGGVEEEPSQNIYWMIYKLPQAPNVNDPPTPEVLTPVGVDLIKVDNKEIYLFWRQHVDIAKHQ